jgi:hypothetical protein
VLHRLTTPPPTTSNRFSPLDNDDIGIDICLDSGATTTIVPLDFPLEDKTATQNGIRVRLCTGGLMIEKSKGKLSLNLPLKARLANKMNVNTPLLSVGQAADQGCVSIFTKAKVMICDEKEIEIILEKPPIIEGKRGNNGLWHVAMNTKKKDPVLYRANSAYTQDTAQDLAMYLHACAGYPIIATWCKAIENGNYRSWPNLSASTGPKWVRKYLPKSIETTMIHMKAICSGTRSTKDKNRQPVKVAVEDVIDDNDEAPELARPRSHIETAKNHQVECGIVEVKQSEVKGLVSSDLPGRFPFTSNHSNNYILSCTTSTPIRSLENQSSLKRQTN